jgi:hypothetical protein
MQGRIDHWLVFAASGLALLAGGIASAEYPAKNAQRDPSAEQRQQMAEIHRKMADCLASTRPLAECRAEMHASCQAAMGKDGCPMMMGSGHGMLGGGGMMQGAPKPPESGK